MSPLVVAVFLVCGEMTTGAPIPNSPTTDVSVRWSSEDLRTEVVQRYNLLLWHVYQTGKANPIDSMSPENTFILGQMSAAFRKREPDGTILRDIDRNLKKTIASYEGKSGTGEHALPTLAPGKLLHIPAKMSADDGVTRVQLIRYCFRIRERYNAQKGSGRLDGMLPGQAFYLGLAEGVLDYWDTIHASDLAQELELLRQIAGPEPVTYPSVGAMQLVQPVQFLSFSGASMNQFWSGSRTASSVQSC
jgi:hypothetical protein